MSKLTDFEKGERIGIQFCMSYLSDKGWPSMAKTMETAYELFLIRLRRRENEAQNR